MSRAEMIEGVAMLVIIVAWWPAIFLGWDAAWYRIPLYAVSLATVLVVFVRRLRRLHEALGYSRRLIEQQQQLKQGPLPPLTVQPPSAGKGRTSASEGQEQRDDRATSDQA
ncbi:MAG: hypothetical protein N2512_07305 [Armatimonadetes bacterium]|nr:hypothetical protein [Armatimonadota bacterium]